MDYPPFGMIAECIESKEGCLVLSDWLEDHGWNKEAIRGMRVWLPGGSAAALELYLDLWSAIPGEANGCQK